MVIDNNANSRDPLDGGIEERLDALAESNMYTMWENIIVEILQSWYPNLSEKEIAICEWTFYTMWDLNQRKSAWYDEVIARLVEINIFANEKEIEDVIKNLVSASVLQVTQEIWIMEGRKESLMVLVFTEEDMHNELMKASCENFERVTYAYFYPSRKFY